MRISQLVAYSVAVTCLTVSSASAQGTGGQPTAASGHRVAVVDVGKIFKEAPAIQSQIASVKEEMEAFDKQLKGKREKLQAEGQKLKQFKSGTPEYIQIEESLANMETQLRLEMGRKRQELANAEARIYYDNYQQIVASVQTVAEYNKLNLVLRYNSEEMDQEQSDSVLRGVMKNVVYHDKSLDITGLVMQVFAKRIAQR